MVNRGRTPFLICPHVTLTNYTKEVRMIPIEPPDRHRYGHQALGLRPCDFKVLKSVASLVNLTEELMTQGGEGGLWCLLLRARRRR
jgi:hypothetical protein